MTISFLGGPYDGLKLGVVEVERYFIVLSVPARGGPRRFIYLPAIGDWPEVLAGRMSVADSREFHYYELVRTPDGLEARADLAGSGLLGLMSRPSGRSGDRNGRRRGGED